MLWHPVKVLLLLQGLTFYMPVESRDLSTHSWGGIAIGQHHAIGQVQNCLENDGGLNLILMLIILLISRKKMGECWPWVAVNTGGLDWEKVNREIGIKSLLFWGKLGSSQPLGVRLK